MGLGRGVPSSLKKNRIRVVSNGGWVGGLLGQDLCLPSSFPSFGGPPNFINRGKNVTCVHANVPRFNT